MEQDRMNARSFRWNPFHAATAQNTNPTDTAAEESIMNDNVHPLNDNPDFNNAKKSEPLAEAIHAASEGMAGAADAVKGAADNLNAKVSKPGFFATRAGRIVKGAAIVAGGGLVGLGAYAAYRAINAVTDGAVGEAVGEAAEATGDAVAEAAEEVVAAIFNR
jgi:hypothetical protein